MQEVFIRVYKALDSFRNESSLSTWIYRIATNAMIDRRKSGAYRFSRLQNEINGKENHYDNTLLAASFDLKIEKDEMYACIRQFIDELTDKNRSVFVLSQYSELSNAEIAEVLQISIDSVKIRLFRARESLKASLTQNCKIYFDDRNEISCEPK